MKQPEELRGKQHIPQLQRKIKKKKIAVLPPTSYFINTCPWSQGEARVEDMNSLTRFILPMGKQRLPFGIPHRGSRHSGSGARLTRRPRETLRRVWPPREGCWGPACWLGAPHQLRYPGTRAFLVLLDPPLPSMSQPGCQNTKQQCLGRSLPQRQLTAQ